MASLYGRGAQCWWVIPTNCPGQPIPKVPQEESDQWIDVYQQVNSLNNSIKQLLSSRVPSTIDFSVTAFPHVLYLLNSFYQICINNYLE